MVVDKPSKRFTEPGGAASVELRFPGASARASGGYKVSEWGGSKKSMLLLFLESGVKFYLPRDAISKRPLSRRKAGLGCKGPGIRGVNRADTVTDRSSLSFLHLLLLIQRKWAADHA